MLHLGYKSQLFDGDKCVITHRLAAWRKPSSYIVFLHGSVDFTACDLGSLFNTNAACFTTWADMFGSPSHLALAKPFHKPAVNCACGRLSYKLTQPRHDGTVASQPVHKLEESMEDCHSLPLQWTIIMWTIVDQVPLDCLFLLSPLDWLRHCGRQRDHGHPGSGRQPGRHEDQTGPHGGGDQPLRPARHC